MYTALIIDLETGFALDRYTAASLLDLAAQVKACLDAVPARWRHHFTTKLSCDDRPIPGPSPDLPL